MRARRRPARLGVDEYAPAGAQSPGKVAQAGEAVMSEGEAVTFHFAMATRRDDLIVIALFDGDPIRNVVLLKGSIEAVRGLHEKLGSALIDNEK